mgnify:CR=1 FL=1
MNDLDVSFEDSPWEAFLRTKRAGDTVSAANLLTMLEEENEQVVEDALQALEDGGLNLNVFDLPKASGGGEAALRLRQEVQLVEKGLNPKELEPNDPLRLYLEEVAQLSTSGDEQALAARCAAADERAMEALTNLGLHRVLEIAKAHVGCGVLLLDFMAHVILLFLIAGEDADLADVGGQEMLEHRMPEAARAAGDEKSLILKNAVCHNILLIFGCAKGTVILYNLIHFSTKIAA